MVVAIVVFVDVVLRVRELVVREVLGVKVKQYFKI